MNAHCQYCNEPVDRRTPDTYQRIQGWERKGTGQTRRGGSDILLRERVEEFLCGRCMFRLKRGLSVGQEALL